MQSKRHRLEGTLLVLLALVYIAAPALHGVLLSREDPAHHAPHDEAHCAICAMAATAYEQTPTTPTIMIVVRCIGIVAFSAETPALAIFPSVNLARAPPAA